MDQWPAFTPERVRWLAGWPPGGPRVRRAAGGTRPAAGPTGVGSGGHRRPQRASGAAAPGRVYGLTAPWVVRVGAEACIQGREQSEEDGNFAAWRPRACRLGE